MHQSLLEILAWIEGVPMWAGLAALALGAGIEYVFPPFPGDTITLAGAVLIPTAGWPWPAVLGAVVGGSLVGAALDWWVGVWLAEAEGQTWLHRWTRRERVARKIEKVTAKFQRHGSAYIALNRFVPAFRGVFFLAAGMAGLRLRRVLFFAAVSALLWNAALLGVGALVGYNLESLAEIVSSYSRVVLTGLVAGGLGWWGISWWRKRSRADR